MVAHPPLRDEEASILTKQLGLITRAQAVACGETAASIRTKVDRGDWVQASYGVYRAAIYPVSNEQDALVQCLRAPGRTWASHSTAAWIHGLRVKPPPLTSVTTTAHLKPGPEALVHRTRQMAPCDIAVVRGVPVTAIERTLLDLASHGSDNDLEFAIDEALTTKRTSLEKLEWRLRRIGGRGRGGSARLRRGIEMRQRVGQVDSHLERVVLKLLREAQLPTPELQYPIDVGGRSVRADFAFPEQQVIVEVLGYRWHGGRDRWERDLVRSSDLAAHGWRIVYVTKDQLAHARRDTIDRLRAALGYPPLFIL